MDREITQSDVRDMVRSMLNYYLLVRSGVIVDKAVGPRYLEAVREIEKNALTYIEENS